MSLEPDVLSLMLTENMFSVCRFADARQQSIRKPLLLHRQFRIKTTDYSEGQWSGLHTCIFPQTAFPITTYERSPMWWKIVFQLFISKRKLVNGGALRSKLTLFGYPACNSKPLNLKSSLPIEMNEKDNNLFQPRKKHPWNIIFLIRKIK